MKKLVKVEEIESEGLISLLGEIVTFFCLNYIYTGKLTGVNETCILIESPKIVYETGSFTEAEWLDAQSLPSDLYLQISAIESFGKIK